MVEVRLLFELEIRNLLGPKEAFGAVRDAFVKLSRGEVVLPSMIGIEVPETRTEAHVKGAYLRGAPYFSVKAASGSYDNPMRGLPVSGGLVMVFDAMTGLPCALLFDNGYLTDLRTGAAGALAASLLAKASIDRVGIVGVGTQARYQLEALLGVRQPKAVAAWGRDRSKAEAYAAEMTAKHRIPVEAVGSPEVACRGSDLVITVTSSHDPLIRANWIELGTHITAVGSDGPDKQELDVDVLQKADKVVADHVDQCLRFGEIHHAVRAGVFHRDDIYADLGEIAAGTKPGRESDGEITIADLTGVGVQDAAVANRVVEQAIEHNLGRVLEV
jgi:ornithine cyclodeaminase